MSNFYDPPEATSSHDAWAKRFNEIKGQDPWVKVFEKYGKKNKVEPIKSDNHDGYV